MTPEERAESVLISMNLNDGVCMVNPVTLREMILMTIKEAMRDQRCACAEAAASILATGDKTKIMCFLYQAIMNTDVK